MEIHNLGAGESPPDGSNSVTTLVRGDKAGFEGVYQAGMNTATTVCQYVHEGKEAALQAGLLWAQQRKIALLYVKHPDA